MGGNEVIFPAGWEQAGKERGRIPLKKAGLSGGGVLSFDLAEEFLPDGVELAPEERVLLQLLLDAGKGAVHGGVVAVEQFANFGEGERSQFLEEEHRDLPNPDQLLVPAG